MKKRRIGYIKGSFDMFNLKHLNILKIARKKCEFLIVGINTQESIERNKYKNPLISFNDRFEIVSAIKYVDKVIPLDNNLQCVVDQEHIDIVFDVPGEDDMKLDEESHMMWENKGIKIICIGSDQIEKEINNLYSNHRSNGAEDTNRSKDTKTIGYTTGVYDMFHIGHLNILKRAKEKCDYLIVGVSTDECVKGYKNRTPICNFKEREQIVSAIKYVDEVVPQVNMDKTLFLKERHFDVMFHGDEWKGTDLYNSYEEQFKAYGAVIEYLSHTEGISSTLLRTKLNQNHEGCKA